MEPATNLSVDVQPGRRRLGLSCSSQLRDFKKVEARTHGLYQFAGCSGARPGVSRHRRIDDFRPETAAPLNELVNVLLRGESTLTRGERELIATHVSWRNDCFFCQTIHGAVAAAQLGHNDKWCRR